MKLFFYFIIIVVSFFASCKKRELIPYDTTKTFIYFGVPQFNLGSLSNRLDSLNFSFVFESDTLRKKILAFPIKLIGQKKNYDRMVAFRIKKEGTTISDSLIKIIPPVVRAGHFEDTLYIEVRRTAVMQQQSFSLALELTPNQNFEPGIFTDTQFKVTISDQLTEPPWWFDWSAVMGPYRKEVYQKWIDIYYIGADTSPPTNEGDKPNFAWNNMPPFAEQQFYPVTFFYIDLLRTYFQNHAVYPDGDTSRPRIYIP